MLKDILTTPTAQLGKASRFAVFQIKLWTHCARLLKKNRSGQQAAALSYHTLFGLVPLAIVMLLIFQSFPAYSDIGNKLETFAFEQLNLSAFQSASDSQDPTETVTLPEYLDNLVSGFFSKVNKGSVTLISVIIVIWAAFALLSTIERAFNNIWHVTRPRGFIQRMINYWALLTLGPLLLGVGVYITTRYATFDQLQRTVLAHVGPVVFSYMVATIAFFLLYFVLPNTKVDAKAAIWGAAVAALVWSLAKWGFGIYVTRLVPYSKVYGTLGLIPLTVFWIYVSWLVVLFGLQLTFTTQHLTSLDAAEIASSRRTEDYFIANDLTVINIVREIAVAFKNKNGPVESEVVCSKLDLPPEFGDKILAHLVDNGILIKSSQPQIGFVPATDAVNIKLSDITQAVAAAGFGQSTQDSAALEQLTQSQQAALAEVNLKQILDSSQEKT